MCSTQISVFNRTTFFMDIISLPPNRYPRDDQEKKRALVAEVVRKMSALPGVKAAAVTNFLPLSGFWGITTFLLRGQAEPKRGETPEADDRVITPGYLRTMGIPVLRGRAFTDADRAGGLQVAMINQTMAKQFFKGRDPVGEELNLGEWRTNLTGGELWALPAM